MSSPPTNEKIPCQSSRDGKGCTHPFTGAAHAQTPRTHRLSFSFAGRCSCISPGLVSTWTANQLMVSPSFRGSNPYPCGSLTYRVGFETLCRVIAYPFRVKHKKGIYEINYCSHLTATMPIWSESSDNGAPFRSPPAYSKRLAAAVCMETSHTASPSEGEQIPLVQHCNNRVKPVRSPRPWPARASFRSIHRSSSHAT